MEALSPQATLFEQAFEVAIDPRTVVSLAVGWIAAFAMPSATMMNHPT